MKKYFSWMILLALLMSGRMANAGNKYWDTSAGAGNGVGGTATWGTTFSTTTTGDATLTTAATTDDDIFQGTAGTITLSAAQTANSLTFNTTGYAVTTSSGATRILSGPIILANNVTLSLSSFGGTGELDVSGITGGASSAITIAGACSASTDVVAIGLNSGSTIAASAPITIATTGVTGLSGFKPASGTATINATIVNNSGVTTMLGAASGNTLNLGGVISGSAGVQFSSGTSGGAGTVNLNAANNWTGPTLFNGTASGSVKLGIANALPTATALIMGATSGNGQKLDLNGFDQTIGSLTSVSGGTGSITNTGSGAVINLLTIGGSTTPAAFTLPINDNNIRKISLVRSGSGTITLAATNTYSGNTTITNTGTLALGANSSISNSPQITIASGATFDVSAAGFTFTGSSPVQNLAGGSGSGTASINATAKTVTLASGATASFRAVGGGASAGKISVTGNLTLNANVITISVDSGVLGAGTYRLLDCTGTLTGLANAAPTIIGAGSIISRATVSISTTTGATGHVDLVVTKVVTSVTVQSFANPSGYSNSVSFAATNLPATASGNIIFLTNGTAFDTEALTNGGTTSAATTLLPRGTNTITAQYAGDNNYLGSTNDLAIGQIVTNHPPVANISTYFHPAGFSLKIPIPGSLSTNWSDADGDTVNLTNGISSTNSALVSYDDLYVYYIKTNNAADQINYTIGDGHGGFTPGVINILITPGSTNVTQNITGITNISGNITISFASVSNTTNFVQWTTNLATQGWIIISTNVAGTNGLWQYTDTNPPSPSFYRSMRAP